MVTEFEYKGKRFFTENLDKKLKRLKTTIDKINIINVTDTKLNQKKEEVIEWVDNKWAAVWDKENNTIIQKLIDNLEIKPDIYKMFENSFWNNETKTGIRNITIENLQKGNLILLDGYPKFPLEIIDGLPVLLIKYNWK